MSVCGNMFGESQQQTWDSCSWDSQ